MRWATFMESGLIREIVEGDDASVLDGHDGVEIPDDVAPVPGKWRYTPATGFYADPQMLQNDMTAAIQNRLDDYAVSKGYNDILSAVSYAGSTHPVFGPQGIAARDWRDACWSKGLEILSQVEARTIPCPTEDELVAALPAPGW